MLQKNSQEADGTAGKHDYGKAPWGVNTQEIAAMNPACPALTKMNFIKAENIILCTYKSFAECLVDLTIFTEQSQFHKHEWIWRFTHEIKCRPLNWRAAIHKNTSVREENCTLFFSPKGGGGSMMDVTNGKWNITIQFNRFNCNGVNYNWKDGSSYLIRMSTKHRVV